MSSYKVPQDVEAEDKLLGPFSFRQFIYLIVAAIGIALCWGLGRLFLPLAVFPIPVVVLFGLLALPLKKDQPMETYLLAILSFYIKPRKRLWQPDGVQSLVEITAPKEVEVQRVKDISRGEAARRLSYLADVVDSQGWSVRGVSDPEANNSMVSDVYYEAQQTDDILDNDNVVSRSFDQKIEQTSARRRQEAIDRMHNPAPQPTNPYTSYTETEPTAPASQPQQPPAQPAPQPQPTQPQPTAPTESDPELTYNPYPTIRQSVVSPEGNRVADYQKTKQPEPAPQPQPAPAKPAPQPTPEPQPNTTSEKPVSPDIINLANNSDLSIQTIANEAGRINKKESELKDDEVVISLR